MREVDEKDEQEPSPYLRRSKRVEVRRGPARWKRVLLIGLALLMALGGVAVTAAYAVGVYLSGSPRFVFREGLAVAGAAHFSPDQIARVFAGDAGRSIYDVPLERRRQEILSLPWVENAFVSRGWPNRLRVQIEERQPVAFVRTRSGALSLVDREGTLLPVPRKGKFPYPMLTGVNESQPAADRRQRVARMLAVLQDLDREEPPRSGEISEIDLTDPADAAVTVASAGSAVLLHLGPEHFLERYKYFLEHIEAWRGQYGAVESVDLRYEKQVIVR